MRHVELFSGIGGFRQAMGLLQQDSDLRFNCVGYSEIDANAETTYRANFDTNGEVVMGDIAQFSADLDRIRELPEFDLLTGGFPCQSFSMMGAQRGFEDARGTLFFSMAQLIQATLPSYLVLENVKNLKTHDHGNTFRVIRQTLEDMGYAVWADVFNTSNFGLAQTRNRVYIFATLRRVPQGFDFTAERVRAHFDGLQYTSVLRQENTRDILLREAPKKYYLSERIKPTILSDGTGGYVAKSQIDMPVARPLCATMNKMHRACQDNYFSEDFIRHGIQYDGGVDGAAGIRIRRLMPAEALKLQGFNDAYAENALNTGLSDGALYRQAGNAVSVNVVYAILSYLAANFRWR